MDQEQAKKIANGIAHRKVKEALSYFILEIWSSDLFAQGEAAEVQAELKIIVDELWAKATEKIQE